MPRIARLMDVDPPEWRNRLAYRIAREGEAGEWEHVATSASTGRSRRARGSTLQINRQAGSPEVEFRLRPGREVTSVELAIEDLGLRSAVFALE